MNRILSLASCCAAAFFLVGCAGTKQFVPMPDQSKAVENPSKGRIYVMRPQSLGYAISMSVADGGNPIGSTGSKGYLCWEREPGDVIVSSTTENTSRVSLPVRPGSIHYVLQNVRMGVWVARTDLEVVDETRGKAALKKCKPAKVVQAPK
jgi:hypothetical protein